jgi:hypothetical protein
MSFGLITITSLELIKKGTGEGFHLAKHMSLAVSCLSCSSSIVKWRLTWVLR